MIEIDPQQELFTALKLRFEDKGYKVFDSLPGEDEPYPFIFLGETRQTDQSTKGAIIGTVNQDLQIWHTAKNRGALSGIMLEVKQVCRELTKTSNYTWAVRSISGVIRNDRTTATPLIFGDMTIEFLYS